MPESTLRKACQHVANRVAERALSDVRPRVATSFYLEEDDDLIVDADDADDDDGDETESPYMAGYPGRPGRWRRRMTPEQRQKMRARNEAFREAKQKESAERDDLNLLLVLSTSLSALEGKPWG